MTEAFAESATAASIGLPQIGLAGALLGGLLSLLSPCSALLLPSFFAYSFGRIGPLVARTAVFYVGLAAVLVPLGAGVGAIGALLTRYRTTVTTLGGIVMIGLGVLIVLGRGFAVPGVSGRLSRLRLGSFAGVAALGALYGLAGFCAGPLLGAVLTVAAAGGSAAYGGLLMGVYAIGMAAPLAVLAVAWDRWRIGERRWLRGKELRLGPLRTHSTSLVAGALFAAIGVLFVATSGTANLGGLVGVDTEYDLQVWVMGVARWLADAWVILGLLVALAVILAARLAFRRAPGGSGGGSDGAAVTVGAGDVVGASEAGDAGGVGDAVGAGETGDAGDAGNVSDLTAAGGTGRPETARGSGARS